MIQTEDILQAKQELWRRGNLKWKLHKHQRKMYDLIKAADASDYFVLLCSRRTGKTFTLLIIALEECLKQPNFIVNLASTTQKELHRAIYPNLAEILKDCPNDVRPVFKAQQSLYQFPNGSRLIIAGTNNGHQDDLRGGTSNLNLIDEAGQIDNLRYLIGSVMNPMTATTLGRTIIASTPAPTSGHDFFTISEIARLRDTFIRFTIYDSGHLDQAAIEKIYKECMETDAVDTLEDSDTFRREYMCEWITDSNRKIIKQWKGNNRLIQGADTTHDHYQFYHKYLGIDFGFKRDFTAILWAHYNFDEAKLYIEDEYVNKGVATITSRLQQVIKDREAILWPNLPVYMRWSDNDQPQMLSQMAVDYDLTINATAKGPGSLQAGVNKVQIWVQNKKIIVDPKCKQLIGCLDFGIWNTTLEKFDRTEAYGHFDALMALIYLVRNIDIQTCPIPLLHNIDHSKMHVPAEMLSGMDRQTMNAFKAIVPSVFNKKR